MTDCDFEKAYEKCTKAEMDLIIERQLPNTPALNVNFPCFLLENDEVLELRFIKRTEPQNPQSGPKTDKHDQDLHLKRPEDLVLFLINTTGGKNIQNKIMENKTLKKIVDYVCVVAVKGDTVKRALRKDGRFAKGLFKKDFALEDDMRNITKMKNYVDELKNKRYSIVLNSAVPVPDSLEMQDGTDDESPPTSKADSCQHLTDPKGHSSEKLSFASDKKRMPTTAQLKYAFKDRTVEFIPNTGEILNILRAQFDSLVQQMKARKQVKSGQERELLREEFSKETQCFSHIKTVKNLMDLSASVCQIRFNHQAIGTGFLLFDRYILTNAHVITHEGKLLDNLSVMFNFEDLSTANKEEFAVKRKPVAYEFVCTQEHNMDFALMELKTSAKALPSPLLKNYSAPPARGGVCIIGHPGSDVKKMDSCLIVERAKQEQAVLKYLSDHHHLEHFQIIGEAFFETKQRLDDSQIEYHSCFFHGSSGSPVFDEHCNVIGMHTGGYVHPTVKKQFISVIEYALPLFPILVSILRQTKEKRKHVWDSFSNENNTKLVMQQAEDNTYRPDLTDENVWDALSSEDEEASSEEEYKYSGEREAKRMKMEMGMDSWSGSDSDTISS